MMKPIRWLNLLKSPKPVPMIREVVMSQRTELRALPTTVTQEQLEELGRIQDDIARVMDAQIMEAFLGARRRLPGNPRMEILMTPQGESSFSRAMRDAYITGRPAMVLHGVDGSSYECVGDSEVIEGEGHFDWRTMSYVPFTPLPSCAQCNKPGLKQTYTSTRDGREICAGCFEGLQDKGLAREQGQPLKKKARHPLDAWMDEKVD